MLVNCVEEGKEWSEKNGKRAQGSSKEKEREGESKKKLPTCVYLQRDLFSLKKLLLHNIICLK